MMYLVKIRKSSIKKNPDAGETQYLVPSGRTTVTLTLDCNPEEALPLGLGSIGAIMCWKVDYQKTWSKNKTCVVVLSRPLTETELKGLEAYNLRDYEVNTPHEVFTSMAPEPKWLYEYLPKKVKCFDCKSTFDYSELIDGTIEDSVSGEYISIENACPKCETSHCCSVSFEGVEEIIRNR